MNLVCFPNNTGGGLLCSLLNKQPVNMIGYSTHNLEHSVFKIGDVAGIQMTIDTVEWNQRVERYRDQDVWFGTHCHPRGIPDRSAFDQVIQITTESRLSRLYRWLRCYHGYFLKRYPDFVESNNSDDIDRVREFAKLLYEPSTPWANCRTVEFEDIVQGKFVFDNNLDVEQFRRWQQNNWFLYNSSQNLWCGRRFNEAEYECETNTPWQYR